MAGFTPGQTFYAMAAQQKVSVSIVINNAASEKVEGDLVAYDGVFLYINTKTAGVYQAVPAASIKRVDVGNPS